MESAYPGAQPIDDDGLFAAWRAPAPPVVVCATRRLQQHLLQRFGDAQAATGQTVWQRPPCVTREEWLDHAYADAARTAAAQASLLPRVLGHAEIDAAWRRIVERDLAERPLLDARQAARQAGRAWSLCCEHAIALPLRIADDPDAEAFSRWAGRFEHMLSELEAEAPERLPLRLTAALAAGDWQPPARIVLAGFDQLSPAMATLLTHLGEAGSVIETLSPPQRAHRRHGLPATDSTAELRLAAQTVLQLAEAESEARIGVVIHNLGAHRQAVLDAFDAALWPNRSPSDTPEQRPWNLSLGAPLAEQALVADALDWLDWAARGGSPRPLHEATRLLLSPYWAGAPAAIVGACDLRWRKQRHERIGLSAAATALMRYSETSPGIAATVQCLEKFSLSERPETPSHWASAFARALGDLGWPRSARLDSGEFQALQAWNETLAQLGSLDAVLGRVRATTAVSHLREMLGNRLFQPRGTPARIQVMGALEAGGLAFDHLLLLGMEETAWPPAAEPNPFLPVALQRAAGIKSASADGQLASARRISDRLLEAAPNVYVLWPQQIDEQAVAPSPLLGLPVNDADGNAHSSAAAEPEDARWRQLFDARLLEPWQDTALPVVAPEGPLPGGIGRLREQAECPFRGAVRFGLDAQAPETVAPAPDALERGLLLHAALAGLWRALRDQRGLLALDMNARAKAVQGAVDAALAKASRDAPHRFTQGVCAIESERLPKLIGQLLAVDAERPAFAVEMIEGAALDASPDSRDKPVIDLDGLMLHVVPDRVDVLEGGGRLVLDYKSGASGSLLAERLRAPQLPVYAELVEDCVGVAFAKLRAGDTGYEGLLDEAAAEALPGARRVDKIRRDQRERFGIEDWADLRAFWRDQLGVLAAEILAGTATVTPLAADSCRYCDLQALCRIGEDTDASTEERP